MSFIFLDNLFIIHGIISWYTIKASLGGLWFGHYIGKKRKWKKKNIQFSPEQWMPAMDKLK